MVIRILGFGITLSIVAAAFLAFYERFFAVQINNQTFWFFMMVVGIIGILVGSINCFELSRRTKK